MAQRGISRDMVEYVLTNGTPQQDRIVMGRKEALRILEALQDEARLLKKILDKGGVVVVADGDAIITTYNRQRRSPKATNARN
jgi:hypothetical protein